MIRRLTAVGISLLLVLAAGTALAIWRLESRLDAKISRFGDPFAAIPEQQRASRTDPAGTGEGGGGAETRSVSPEVVERQGAMNLLVFGSDSRISAGDPSQWTAGAQRTDVIMLIHIPADRAHVYAVSIPRDSWVDIPGHGRAKLNAAYSWGGPPLAIRTVERLTKVRIDHLVITDFQGFAKMTDLLGGVDITVEGTTHGNTMGIGENFAAGTHHMDGATALTYIRQRSVLPAGDFDRVKRQQNWIRTMLRAAVEQGAASDPKQLYALLDTMASSLSTDSGFTIEKMRGLALSLRHAGPAGARFLTAPVLGTGTSSDGQAIVELDRTKGAALWAAIRSDRVEQWLADTGYETLSDSVR